MKKEIKRIGFVDYNLENYHANVYLKALREELKDLGFEIAGCWGMKAAEGKEWAKKNGVPYHETVESLDAAVDCYMILAPSNPEVHLELCKKVFPCRKPTYVDKTFAPDLATARKIFALADRCKVAIQTSSALRYTNVQALADKLERKNIRHMVTWGGGGSFGEYAIHPVELLVSCMGPEAVSLMRRGEGDQQQLLIDFSGGRTAVVNVYCNANTSFAASVTTGKETQYQVVDCGKLFVDAAVGILGFLRAGVPNVDRAESLIIRRILDVAAKPESARKKIKL
ncbi:MAG: hypothetical protein PHV34_03525 [Verrucomicrobiae bacterium]|nr:hypothetical protein [Verrucomicrobiae bacterium]